MPTAAERKPIIVGFPCAQCAENSGTTVRAIIETGFVNYLRCDHCGFVWVEPERRKRKRVPGEPKP
jgi:uncharacterized Zn finger protein